MNKLAGRGDFLIVTLRLETGEKLRFIVDTGTSGTLIDQSLAPTLGKPLGKVRYKHWGVVSRYKEYAAPGLYLGDVPLILTNRIAVFNCKDDFPGQNPPILGILGMDVLKNYCIQLDFAAGKMRFLDDNLADPHQWGDAFPIVPLSRRDQRPAVAVNLMGLPAPLSLIDSGCTYDGWLTPRNFQQWTNHTTLPAEGAGRSPDAFLNGEKYPLVDLESHNVEGDGIGLRFLARHLVTLDFPHHTLYLKRQSAGDPGLKISLNATRLRTGP